MVGGSTVEYMRFDPGSGGIVINDGNTDMNLRMEGNGNVNLLFVDAGEDSIYINASAQISDEKFLVNNNDNSKGTISRCTSGSQANDTVHLMLTEQVILLITL